MLLLLRQAPSTASSQPGPAQPTGHSHTPSSWLQLPLPPSQPGGQGRSTILQLADGRRIIRAIKAACKIRIMACAREAGTAQQQCRR